MGIYERISEGRLEACKITFGAEPKDYEVYGFLLKNWGKLRFSPKVEAGERQAEKVNPKRMKRIIKSSWRAGEPVRNLSRALKLLREENNIVRREKSRAQKEEEKQQRFERRQQKKKEKHRGR